MFLGSRICGSSPLESENESHSCIFEYPKNAVFGIPRAKNVEMILRELDWSLAKYGSSAINRDKSELMG